jgi:hypothetical protein
MVYREVLRTWFRSLEDCTSIEEIDAQWSGTLSMNSILPQNHGAVLSDALLSFLALSALPWKLKLATILACFDTDELDPRLAFGAVAPAFECHFDGDATDDAEDIHPATSTRPQEHFALTGTDPWLLGYINGRYAEVSHTLVREDRTLSAWRRRFWGEYLSVCCRVGELDGVELSLSRGAEPNYDNFAAVRAACARTESESDATLSQRMVERLLQAGLALNQIEAPALEAAAAHSNLPVLEWLVASGAHVDTDDGAALVAAAGNANRETIEWLLNHGADLHRNEDAALFAALSALEEGNVAELLARGADVHARNDSALQVAFLTLPVDMLEDGHYEFIFERAGVIEELLNAGARMECMPIDAQLFEARYLDEVLEDLLSRPKRPKNEGAR